MRKLRIAARHICRTLLLYLDDLLLIGGVACFTESALLRFGEAAALAWLRDGFIRAFDRVCKTEVMGDAVEQCHAHTARGGAQHDLLG